MRERSGLEEKHTTPNQEVLGSITIGQKKTRSLKFWIKEIYFSICVAKTTVTVTVFLFVHILKKGQVFE